MKDHDARKSVGATGACSVKSLAVDSGHDSCGLVPDMLREAKVLVGPG